MGEDTVTESEHRVEKVPKDEANPTGDEWFYPIKL